MISVTIDGRLLQVSEGTTVMEAALANDIQIPHLCYHPELRPSGGCRLCLVEIEGRPTLQPSCGLLCADKMAVRTQSERLTSTRREMLDLLLSDHPLDCGVCAIDGTCELQRYARDLGISETSYDHELSRPILQDDNPFYVRDHQYCILCGKCVRVCDEVVGANAIEYSGRGFASHIATPFDGPMIESACVFCGSCVQVCPTPALMAQTLRSVERDAKLDHKHDLLGYCGVGCSIDFALQDGAIVSARGFPEAPANGEFLCVKGRFGWDFATSPERLTQPLVRKDLASSAGLAEVAPASPSFVPPGFVPVSWDTALNYVADRLADTVKQLGPDAVAGLSSARCTNEENYLFQKLMRATVGTNNVDHCARLCHASTVSGLGMAFGSGAMTNPIKDIRSADCIFITGSNTAENHPVISYEVVRAVKCGASLIIVDPRRVPLVDHATLHLQPKPGTDIFVFLAIANVILQEGWADEAFIRERTEGFAEFASSLRDQTPEVASLASGVPAELIRQAALMYALGERQSGRSEYPEARGHSAILYAMGITQRTIGTELVLSLANLAMLTGQIGKPSTGVNPLRGQSNVQGGCDVGALPDVLPGYQSVTDDAKRGAIAAKWGLPDLPAIPGLTVVEMTREALSGKLRAMYIMGENPMLSDPNLGHVAAGLKALEFLVVQDIFYTETAEFAQVLLPAGCWLEKDGTMTSTERRVQLLRTVLPAPGEARPDWQIICDLAARLEARLHGASDRQGAAALSWDYPSTAAVAAELAGVTPQYGGITHDRLGEKGLAWPCPTASHPGTPLLHSAGFTRGRGRFHAVVPVGAAEQTDAEYPIILTTGRILYHYHTGTMTRRSEGLVWREPRGYVEISPRDAAAAGIRDGSMVRLISRRGQVRAQARVGRRVAPGVVFLSFHWKEAPANNLTQDFALDSYAKIPEYKVCAVRLEAVERAGRAAAAVASGAAAT